MKRKQTARGVLNTGVIHKYVTNTFEYMYMPTAWCAKRQHKEATFKSLTCLRSICHRSSKILFKYEHINGQGNK